MGSPAPEYCYRYKSENECLTGKPGSDFCVWCFHENK